MTTKTIARINHIDLVNFRCIKELHLTLPSFTVLIGPNGAGKSALLEGLRLVARLPNDDFNVSFDEFGGFEASRCWYTKEPNIDFGVGVTDGSVTLKYHVTFQSKQGNFVVKSEKLTKLGENEKVLFQRKDEKGSYWNTTGQPDAPFTAGANTRLFMPGMLDRIVGTELLQGMGQRTSSWKAHRFQPDRVVRSPQQLTPTTVPDNAGSNLYSALYTLRTDRRKVYDELLETVRAAVPEFVDMDFPLAKPAHADLAWDQTGFERPLKSSQLSDGTLRLLWLLTVLFSSPDDGLILIDEPEFSLHPQWLMLLVSQMRKVSARTTIVVATQSAEFVHWVEPAELLVVDATENGAQFSWAGDHPNLDKWLEDFTLSELWTMGELGGRR